MKEYLLDICEYTKITRHCASIADDYPHEAILNILMDLLHARYDYGSEYYVVPESLMQRIAIANLCDMALIQYHDTRGEIDYAFLGRDSESVLASILSKLDNI